MESQPLVTQSDIGQLSLGYGASQPFQLTQNTELTQVMIYITVSVESMLIMQSTHANKAGRFLKPTRYIGTGTTPKGWNTDSDSASSATRHHISMLKLPA
eukprot:1144170-Pelagomonas_calceolata.AAC.1